MVDAQKLGSCRLCGRLRDLTFHHFIPRTLHANKWFKRNFTREEMKGSGAEVCDDCHDFLHLKWKPKELARNLNTIEKLRAEPQIAAFVAWVRKKRT